ncbi:MAG: Bug family tripartite tricarboxylate transporter substrate binding protein [Burkholderiales bacterium]
MRLSLGLALGFVTFTSIAQTWPAKPIRIVSNSAAGSPGDISLRLAAPRIGAALGQPLVVEQKGGGGGMIAVNDVQRNGPDGYAILFSSSLIIGGRFLLKNVTVDLQKDFIPISMATRSINLLGMHNSVPVSSARELVEYAKRNPGKLTVSSNGIGSSLHLQWLGFMRNTGADFLHIPYGSQNEAIRNNDFLTGRLSLALIPLSTMKAAMDAGAVRPLAVMGDSRYKRSPDIPAVTEAFPGYKLSLGFFAFYGPLGLPQPIVNRFAAEVQKAFKDPEIVAKLEAIDVQAVGNSPEEFAPFLNAYVANIAELVKSAGLEPQ